MVSMFLYMMFVFYCEQSRINGYEEKESESIERELNIVSNSNYTYSSMA